MALADINTKPTQEIADEAEQALEWRAEFGRGGTEVGVARARDLKNRVNLSIRTIKRMFSYLSRHEVDKKGKGFYKGDDGYPSAGRIAWGLSLVLVAVIIFYRKRCIETMKVACFA